MATGKFKLITGYHIVAMPYPGRGHINPMVNVCTLLASKEINITLVLTEEWLGLVGSVPDSPNFRLRSIPNVLPSEPTRGNDFIGFVNAVYTKMEAPFGHLLDHMQRELPTVSCIIADTFLAWMPTLGSRRNIPVVSLWTQAPSVFSIFCHFDLLAARGHFPGENLPEKGEEIIDYIPGVSSMHLADLPSVCGILKRTLEAFSSVTKAQAILFTSFSELQPNVSNALRDKLQMPIYAIGPSIPYMSLSTPIHSSHEAYFNWLNSQPEASVLYVSLGSYLSMSKEQMQELSTGLQASGARYLWIFRGEALGLQESCGKRGLIAPWCDQLRVLCHPSVAGFLTHCGWNSTMESIFAGVPMLTFPLSVDQTHNSKLIVEDWRVGLKLKAIMGAENVVGREKIAQTVKRLMDLNGNEGKELTRRAKELQETCRGAIEIGGSTESNINAFVREFVQGKCDGAI